jgi:hypothetical protein
MCESGFKDLIERRKRKIIEMVLHVAEDAEHPMNQHLENRRAYDQYAERPKLIRPFFVRALEGCSAMEIVLIMVERRRTPGPPFWTNMSAENIITYFMATPSIDRIRADMEHIINENGLREYQRQTRLDEQLSGLRRTSK